MTEMVRSSCRCSIRQITGLAGEVWPEFQAPVSHLSSAPLSQIPATQWYAVALAAEAGRRRRWHPTPVLLPGKSHGQRRLVGCVYGVAQSWTRLKRLSSSSSSSRGRQGPEPAGPCRVWKESCFYPKSISKQENGWVDSYLQWLLWLFQNLRKTSPI